MNSTEATTATQIPAERIRGRDVKYNKTYMASRTTEQIEARFLYYEAEDAKTSGKNYRIRHQMEGQRQNREHRDLYAAALRDRYAGLV